MSRFHTVEQGDHVARLASRAGFLTVDPIWSHPNNAALRQERQNPHILFPGDVVFIPDRDPGRVSSATGLSHRFVLRRMDVEIRIVLLDSRFRTQENRPCELTMDGGGACDSTDSKGLLRAPIPPNATTGRCVLSDQPFDILVGFLDPESTLSGARARLNNLGYEAGESEDSADPDLRSAIEEFQCDHGLPVTGDLDPSTTTRLATLHGC